MVYPNGKDRCMLPRMVGALYRMLSVADARLVRSRGLPPEAELTAQPAGLPSWRPPCGRSRSSPRVCNRVRNAGATC